MIECKSHDQCEEDESNQISSGWSCENLETSTERGEDRDTNCSEQEVDDKADCSVFHSENKDCKKDCKVCKGDRNRAEWQRDGKWSEDAGYCSHQAMSTICFVFIFWLSTATVPEVSFCDISIYSFRS